MRLGVNRIERVIERRSAHNRDALRGRQRSTCERDRFRQPEVRSSQREDARRLHRSVDRELEALPAFKRDRHERVLDDARCLRFDFPLELFDRQACGHHIAELLDRNVAGLVNDALKELGLARRHELEDFDANCIARGQAVLQLARNKIFCRGRRRLAACHARVIDHVEPRQDWHGGRSRLEIARTARIEVRVNLATREREQRGETTNCSGNSAHSLADRASVGGTARGLLGLRN